MIKELTNEELQALVHWHQLRYHQLVDNGEAQRRTIKALEQKIQELEKKVPHK